MKVENQINLIEVEIKLPGQSIEIWENKWSGKSKEVGEDGRRTERKG